MAVVFLLGQKDNMLLVHLVVAVDSKLFYEADLYVRPHYLVIFLINPFTHSTYLPAITKGLHDFTAWCDGRK